MSDRETHTNQSPLVTIAGIPQPPVPQAVTPPPAVSPSTAPQEPPAKKGKLLWAGVAAAALLLAGGLLFKDPLTMRLAPKTYLAGAFTHTQKATAKEREELAAYSLPLPQGPQQHSFTLRMPEENLMPATIDGELLLDQRAETLRVTVSTRDTDLVKLDTTYYQSPELMAIQSPPLLDHFLTLNPATWVQDYNSSPLGQRNPLEEGTKIGLDLGQQGALSPQQADALGRELQGPLQKLNKKATVSYLGEGSRTAENHTFTGDLFTFDLSEADARAFLKECATILYQNEDYWALVSQNLQQNTNLTPGQQEQLRQKMLEEISTFADELSLPGGVTAQLGISPQKCIDYIQVTIPLAGDSDLEEITCTTFITGEKYRSSGLFMNLEMVSTGQQPSSFTLEFSSNPGEEDPRKTDLALRMNLLGMLDATMDWNSTYDLSKAEGENLTGQFKARIPMLMDLSADFAGRIDADRQAQRCEMKGVKTEVQLTLNPLLTGSAGGAQATYLLDYTCAPYPQGAITLPADAQTVSLFSLEEEDQMAAIDLGYEAIGTFMLFPLILLGNLGL